MERAVKVSTSATMAPIEETWWQQAAYTSGTLNVKSINLSNVENMIKSMGL